MRTKLLSAAAATAIGMLSANAEAAVTVTGVSISGIGTTYAWDTSNDLYNTVFITQYVPKNTITYNSSSEAIAISVLAGDTAFSIHGDGQPVGNTAEAALSYLITVVFSNGLSIGGIYNSAFANDPDHGFIGTNALTVDHVAYSLSSFDWNRSTGRGSNTVGPRETGPGGDTHDYSGQFSISIVTVPEPATWMMMFAGFGLIGAGLRMHAKIRTRIAYG